jgi:hypothetical protein
MASIQSVLHSIVENIRDVKQISWRFPLRHLAAAIGKKIVNVRIRDFGNINIRTKSTDAAVVRQIFKYKEYDMSGFSQFKRVQYRYDELRGGPGCLNLAYPVCCQCGNPMLNFGHGFPWFSDDAPRISAGIPR